MIPAQAGIHQPTSGTADEWVPAVAGSEFSNGAVAKHSKFGYHNH